MNKIHETAQELRDAAIAASVLIDHGHNGTARELVNQTRWCADKLIELLNDEVKQ